MVKIENMKPVAQRQLEKIVNDLREMLSTVPGLALSEDEQVRLADYLETVRETLHDAVKKGDNSIRPGQARR